jgi:glycosyltransferase involved in cell wall biosynthesis
MIKPLITIGLTTFNSFDTVESALDSALSQSWENIEIVVVDDVSTDGTFEFLNELALKNPKIRVFSTGINGGVAVSRNRVLAESRGEFVAFFDDDDISHPERIEAQYKRTIEYENNFAAGDPVICHTSRKVLYPNGEIRIHQTMGKIEGQKAPFGIAVAKRILIGERIEDGNGACPTCSQFCRLSTYNFIGGFDPKLRRGEDTDFNIRLAKLGGHFVGIDKPLVIQRMTSTSEKSLHEEYKNDLFLLKKHRTLIEHSVPYSFCLQWLDLKYLWLSGKKVVFVKKFLMVFLKYPLITLQRLVRALPNISLNRAFRRFHCDRDKINKTHDISRRGYK